MRQEQGIGKKKKGGEKEGQFTAVFDDERAHGALEAAAAAAPAIEN